MSTAKARCMFCFALFLILFVGFFSVVTHDQRTTLTAFNHSERTNP